MYYKSLIKKMLVLAVVVTSAVSANGQTLNLTLDECIRIALNDNPSIIVADMEIQRVDYSKKEVLGQLFPQVNLQSRPW